MNILILKNGQLVDRFILDEDVEITDFTIELLPSIPKRPTENAGVGMQWKLAYVDNILQWVKVERPLTSSEILNMCGGIRNEKVQSDKVGYDFINFYVNDILVKQEYTAQDNPIGVESNPFIYSEDLALIPNAYYIKDDVVKVWVGEKGVSADWEDEKFVEM